MDRRKILLTLAVVVAAFGTLLVFLYVQSAEERAQADFDGVEVLRAVQTVEPGESFDDAQSAGKFAMEEVAGDQVLDGAQTGLSGLTGLKATTRIYPGEQVTANKWGGAVESTSLAIPEGQVAISVNLTDPARVAGFVTPGSEVTIFMTETDPDEQEPQFTRTLLKRVQVLGIGTSSTVTSTTTSGDGESTTEQLPSTLMTLALSQADAAKVTYASWDGELSLGLLTGKSKVDRGPVVESRNLFE